MRKLRTPRTDELKALSALCLRSKAHWGYDADFMAACVAELTLTPDDLTTSSLQLAEDKTGLIGVAQVKMMDGETASLEALFIDPSRMVQAVAGCCLTGRLKRPEISAPDT